MGICNHIILKEKDIVSVVGAGGKTSFIFQLAEEIKNNKGKILLTTTTKIYLPSKEQYDFICIGEEKFLKYAHVDKKGIYVCGKKVNSENKIIGLEEVDLDKITSQFNYTIIEADGAKEKQIKGWSEKEPVIYKGTTKTVGILDIQTVGMDISEEKVHRISEFCEITNSKLGEKITTEDLLKVIIHPQGLFKGAKGEKILFINKTDDLYYLREAKKLKDEINKLCPKFLDKIIIESIKNIREIFLDNN